MNRSRSRLICLTLFAVLLLVALVAAACGGGTTTTSAATPTSGAATTAGSTPSSDTASTAAPTTASSAAGEQPVLKVGALLSLDTIQGVEMKKWLELFAKMYNDAGGWKIGDVSYKVQPMIYDVGVYDAAKSRSAAEKAVLQDGVKYMVCNWGDIPAETLSVTEPNKVLWMGLDFTDGTVAPTLKYSIRAQGLFFAQGLFYYIEQDYMKQGAKSMLVVSPDTQQGQSGSGMVGASAKAAGMTVIDPVLFASDTTDFGPIATKIMSSKPDAVFLSYVAGDQVINIIGALKDSGYKGKILPGELDGTSLANLIKRVGVEYVEGMETGSYDPSKVETDAAITKYIDAYKAAYGDWHTEGCFWVGPWFLFEDAINGTQSTDVDKLVAYLQDSKHGVRTLTGYSQLFARPDIGNNKTVDAAPGHYLGIVKNGKLEYLSTIACKDQYLSSIMVYGLGSVYQKYWTDFGKPTFPDQPSRFEIDMIK
jgi:ABC-type branched-subunit amino acid transport system substrate-binding protein